MSIIKPDHKTYSVDNVKPPGPVSNLEKYVKPDWWRYLFNPIYLKTDADVVNDQSITKSEVDLLIQILRLLPKDKILDLCCGHGRHSLELARRGFLNVDGLDFSRYLIQKAKKECLKECLNVKFKKGDARKIPYHPNTFDVIMLLGNSFGYFKKPHDDMKVLREIYRVLRPCGCFLIDVADGEYLKEHFQPRSWEWIDNKHFACRERSLSQDKQRLITREIVNHVEKGVIADQFYAERLYTKAELKMCLSRTGFKGITFHKKVFTNSQRNQDLGMMERRIILTAVVKKGC